MSFSKESWVFVTSATEVHKIEYFCRGRGHRHQVPEVDKVGFIATEREIEFLSSDLEWYLFYLQLVSECTRDLRFSPDDSGYILELFLNTVRYSTR